MAKQGGRLLNFVAWLTGVIVSLAVAFGMISEVLIIPYLPVLVTVIVGWIVVVTTLLSVILVLLKS